MDSHEPTIEEKLVPFVEGALAEADRREVMQALPNSPALSQEVQQLREVILVLRKQVDRGLSYESPVEAVSEQVVDFALEGSNWSRPAIRQFQLHMLESSRLVEEVEILKELEQDLEQRLEGSQPVPEMPAALRAAIQEAYGKPPADPAWKKALAALVGWFAGMNLKVATAAVTGCLVIAAGVGVGRHLHRRMQAPTTASPALVAEGSSPTVTPSAMVAEAPAGQVALLKEKVLPEDLPGLSRRLWQKQVSHSYRDGQIFVAQADYEKAWSALQINSERVAVAKPLKTGSLPEARPGLPEGVIGMVPNLSDKSKPASAPKSDLPEKSEKVAVSPPPPPPPRPSGPDKEPALAVNLPDSPEFSRRQETVYDYRKNEQAPVVASQGAAAPEPRPYPAAESQPVKPAAPQGREYSQPSQLARTDFSKQRLEREPVAPPPAPVPAPAPTPGGDQGAMGRARKMVATKGSEPAPEIQPVQKPSIPARPALRDSKKSADPVPGSTFAQGPSPSSVPAPAGQDALASRPPQPERNVRQEPKQEEEAPPLQPVALPQPDSASQPPATEAKERDGRVTGGVSDEAPESGSALAKSENVGVYNSKINIVAPKAQVNTVPSAGPAAAGGARRTQAGGSSRAKDSGFEVQGNAPFEVAMLPVAKKLVEELVGEAKVQMERKEDGHLLVTIRPARSLSAQEVDKLRKVVREKLELEDEDTVVIRQP